MKIAIDARVLEKGITGIGRYLEDLLQGLPLLDNKNEYYLFSYRNLNIEPGYYKNISTGKPFLPDKIFSAFWLNFILPKYLNTLSVDLFFTPNQLLPIRKIGAKKIITVHDVAHKENKLYHPLFYRIYNHILLSLSLSRSDGIITISKFSKESICTHYKVEPNKIVIVSRTATNKFCKKQIGIERIEKLKKKFDLPEMFILYVGMIERRKNINGILKISDLLRKKNLPLEFVLIGKRGHGFAEIHKNILRRSNVHYLENVNDNDLVDIYNIAFAFLFPSFFEGFGLPPLEAMQTGLPVLVSNRASLPEVVGEAGIVKEPEDYEGFADEITKLYKNMDYQMYRQNKSIERSSKFDYLKSIEAFLKIINISATD